jgi:hypothetical protein
MGYDRSARSQSRACFETLIWLAEQDFLRYRTVEPQDIGIEGAVLTQKAFVLLTGVLTWEEGVSMSRIEALREARIQRAYDDLGTIIKDILRANCQWGAPSPAKPLAKSPAMAITDEVDST